jgi:recombinational DNA repair ATPase RecF
MGSAREDYEHFVRWLHLPEQHAPEDVRRFANLVLADFDAIAATSWQRNSRSLHLANLARRSLATTTADLPEAPEDNAAVGWPWRRLLQLTIGPFRGFRREEPFDLRKRIVLFYGPNGSGKTSLCDALEYALLGTVQEAEIKRIEEPQYLANIHARRFAAPRLTATDHAGQEVVVGAHPDTYRFCFIEKNRIDAFARLASRPPATRTELIATLFGMEKFNDFANHFNESMDPALVHDPENQRRLNDRRQALVRDQQTIVGEQAAVLHLNEEEAAFAERCRPGITYSDLKALVGTREAPGRLQELEGILNAVPPTIVGLTRQGLVNRYTATDMAADRHRAAVRELETRSSQVAFKDLYTSVLALQSTEANHCPACDTPLERVTRDPFEKAVAGLQELRDLVTLQERAARSLEDLDDASRSLRADLKVMSAFVENQGQAATSVGRYLNALPQAPRGDRWWQDIYAPEAGADDGTPSLTQVLEFADRSEAQDQATGRQLQERQNVVRERDRLQDWQREIYERALQRQRVGEEVAAARARIAAFDAANARLIEQAAQERQNIERDQPIKAAYDRFLPMLRRFRNQLPGVLMTGLNELARDLYNEFNDHDHDADKLAFLYLPLTGEQRIDIAFRGEPQRRLDALAVLSEGHIRCLGLAILLAKSISARSPLVVFDDAVNAIDHDHRGGIRQTIFESDRFRDTQLIVTCHSNEFIKDVQNHLPQHSRNDCGEYLFRHHTGDYHPRVTANEISRSYVAKARAARDTLDDREALTHARRALEMLCNKIWKWLVSFDRGTLIVEIDRAGGEPSLRNLTDAIRIKLENDATFVHANREPILTALRRVLGIPAQNLIWSYLNKGTHEGENRDDFDAAHVESVVRTLEELDALNLQRRRAA